jgi:hypothetical protein
MKSHTPTNAMDFNFVLVFVFAIVHMGLSGQTAVRAINGQPYGTATLMISGQQAKDYPVGQVFQSGTTFETASQTVELGAKGNTQILNPHTRHNIRFMGDKELHTTTKGKVSHHVNIPASRYKISTPGVDGSSITTKFEVEVVGNATRIKSFEGTVNTFQKVPVKVNDAVSAGKGPKNNLNTTVYKSIHEGQELTFYDNPKPVIYGAGTVQDALNDITKQLKQNEENGFPEELLADENALVGELYLDLGEPEAAIPYFKKAIGYYEHFYFAEQDIAEMNLNLAEAYYFLDDDRYFAFYGTEAIKLLLSENELNNEDLHYAEIDEDWDYVKFIKEDLNYNYYNIGWVYEIAGDTVSADHYYNLADEY